MIKIKALSKQGMCDPGGRAGIHWHQGKRRIVNTSTGCITIFSLSSHCYILHTSVLHFTHWHSCRHMSKPFCYSVGVAKRWLNSLCFYEIGDQNVSG